jgi:protein phosphatase
LFLEAFGASDAGKVRETNEDNFVCWDLGSRDPGAMPTFFLLAVADGIGGHAGGAVASGIAAEVLKEDLTAWAATRPRPDVRAALAAVFQRVNRTIFERAAQAPELAGMGTTLTAAVVEGAAATVANVGDSRAYFVRDGKLLQITRDHSWIAEQRRRRLLSEDEIQNSPFKSMITRSLGFLEAIEVDTYDLTAEPGDYLLLCTDGLYGPLSAKRILKTFRRRKISKEISPALVEAAKDARGDDNITAVVARFREIPKRKRAGPLSEKE